MSQNPAKGLTQSFLFAAPTSWQHLTAIEALGLDCGTEVGHGHDAAGPSDVVRHRRPSAGSQNILSLDEVALAKVAAETDHHVVSAFHRPRQGQRGRLQFKRADVAAIAAAGVGEARKVIGPQATSLIGGSAAGVTFIDGRAAP